ncbi:MAG: DUF6088 family protein [Elusimicrobiota bacterium]
MDPTRKALMKRITANGRGYAFTRKDFQGLAPTGSVGKTLSRLAEAGLIRRLGRGIFDYPRFTPSLGGELSPDLDQVAKAIARKFRWTIIPDGAWAANRIGLSQQVPAKIVYLSDGPNRSIRAGASAIRFKHARPKELHAGCPSSGLVIQALRYVGKEHVDGSAITTLRKRLSPQEKKRLLKDARYGAAWILQAAQRIAGA